MYLRHALSLLPDAGLVLDLGGGTGINRSILSESWSYECLDNAPRKLNAFHKKFPKDKAIKASATNIRAPDESYELGILSCVSHHLEASELECAKSEISRVLRKGGVPLFYDAIWNPKNIKGRLLWFLDRGSLPRSENELEVLLKKILYS